MIELRDARVADDPRLHAIRHAATMSSYGRDARRFYARHGHRVVESQTIDLHGRRLAAWFVAKPLGGA